MKLLFISTALCATLLPATAGTTSVITPAPSNPWEFRIQPYGWLTGIDGTTGPAGFAADVDAGFDDIFDEIEMAAALQFEARRGSWGFIADAFYAELGTSGTLPGPAKTDINLDFEQFLGEFVIFYRTSETPQSFVDLYAGVRYNSMSLDLEATSNGTVLQKSEQRSGDEEWADPIIGLRTQWDINERWFIAAKGDIGGFGVNSDFTWNLQGTVGYKFSESVSCEIGYRYFDTDYSDDNYIYDIAQSGVLIGVNYVF